MCGYQGSAPPTYSVPMPLLFLDLDNTLVDRAAAYRLWAEGYLAERGADPALIDEMVLADGDGLRPKPEVQVAVQQLLGLDDETAATIATVLRKGVLDHLALEIGRAHV